MLTAVEPDRCGVVARSADAVPGGQWLGLAVVTVTRSPGKALDRFLDSVQAATTGPVHVVLVDAGSTDGAPERAAQRDGVALLCLHEDIGRGAGANRGVVELGPDVGWIAIVAPDVEYGEGSLDELLAAAVRHPRAGALGPRVRDPGGTVRPSAWELPSSRMLPALVDTLLGAAPAVAPAAEGPVGWLGGSCLLLRRAAWESVDGFDPRYPGPYDDVDLGDRLTRAGWLCVHVPSAEVVVASRAVDREAVLSGRRRYLTDRHTGLRRIALKIAVALHATVTSPIADALPVAVSKRAPRALRAAVRTWTAT